MDELPPKSGRFRRASAAGTRGIRGSHLRDTKCSSSRCASMRRSGRSLRVTLSVVTDSRNCEQCGVLFAPRREHARFCSARCRVAWNRLNASDTPAEGGALGWTITAMRETIDRLLRARGWDRPHAFAVISEAVWWVTMVDATLVRYHPDAYDGVLADDDAAERRVTEDTFAGLRFVRNRMGYDADPADFIQPLDPRPGAAVPRIAAWTWRSLPEPALTSLTPRGREWE